MAEDTTQPQTTLVTFLLDRSGSMESIKTDTIGGFNAYLGKLRASTTPVEFSFLQFDSTSVDTLCKNAPIAKVANLTARTFQPRASTPLIDACVETILAVERALEKREAKPKVVVCFQTDGYENASRLHTWERLNDLIRAKTGEGWQFIFMGASIDAYDAASRMGIPAARAMSYDASRAATTRAGFEALGENTAAYARGDYDEPSFMRRQKIDAGDRYDPQAKARPTRPVGTHRQLPPDAGAGGSGLFDDLRL